MSAPAADASPPLRPMPEPIAAGQPWTALAPMQDVTNVEFIHVLAPYGPPDFFFNEYFRVHVHSRLDAHILRAITENRTGRPVFAQFIGEDLSDLRRMAGYLREYGEAVAGLDLNLGCPAPKVYKKKVGGGLLRDMGQVERIFATLRACWEGRFTVKCRIGFDDTEPFARLLELVGAHGVDAISVHGRTVKGGYRREVDYDAIRQAVESVPCPVLANGQITSAEKAKAVIAHTGAAGVMIGRAAIRNPWIFAQCREIFGAGEVRTRPTLAHVYGYVTGLWESLAGMLPEEERRVARIKKFLNFVGEGVDADGRFLHDMRRTRSARDLFDVCERHLLCRPMTPFAPEPYANVTARPNRECSQPPSSCSLDDYAA